MPQPTKQKPQKPFKPEDERQPQESMREWVQRLTEKYGPVKVEYVPHPDPKPN